MKDLKLTVCLLAAACACLFVIVMICLSNPQTPRHVTLGQLATKDPAVSAGPLKISNCVGGTWHGSYLVFPAGHESRYPVVFSLVIAMPSTTTTFTGDCVGVRVTPLDGCPCEVPFVLVSGAVAVIG